MKFGSQAVPANICVCLAEAHSTSIPPNFAALELVHSGEYAGNTDHLFPPLLHFGLLSKFGILVLRNISGVYVQVFAQRSQ